MKHIYDWLGSISAEANRTHLLRGVLLSDDYQPRQNHVHFQKALPSGSQLVHSLRSSQLNLVYQKVRAPGNRLVFHIEEDLKVKAYYLLLISEMTDYVNQVYVAFSDERNLLPLSLKKGTLVFTWRDGQSIFDYPTRRFEAELRTDWLEKGILPR